MSDYKDNGRHNRRGHLRTEAAAVLLAVTALTGCATTEAAPVQPTTGQLPPTPDKPSTTPSSAQTGEFTPGATGKYSPEALAKLSDAELIKRLEITGTTPEEIAQSSRDTLTAYLASGTVEASDLLNQAGNGDPTSVSDDETDQIVSQVDDKYNHAACVAWNGAQESSACSINKGTREVHRRILYAYLYNRETEKNMPDFQLGHTNVTGTKILSGSFKDGVFQMEVTTNQPTNWDQSVMTWLTSDPTDKNTPLFEQLHSSFDTTKTTTNNYQRVGNSNRYIITDTE